MITRLEQKALYESLLGDLVINTHPDGSSGDEVNIPVDVHWGFEPSDINFPAIVILFNVINRRSRSSLGDVWRDDSNGQFIGFMGESSLLIKIKASDYQTVSGEINKLDILQSLYERIQSLVLNVWDGLIDDGSVMQGEPSPVNDVSQILGLEAIGEWQFTVRFQKLAGGVPTELGIVKYSTAPTLIQVDNDIEYYE